ncbi:MAG: hypothetical protein H0U69_08310 [Trueperaceae bacterium]|nr:hypothetical protein [Trueperaceae bacterium]
MITRHTVKSIAAIAVALIVLVACGTTPPVTPAVDHTLSVTVVGGGSVTSAPAGINVASGTATADFAAGTDVTLTPVAATGFAFSGWTGACIGAGMGACIVDMNADKRATATFTAIVAAGDFTLSVSVTGTGEGTVTSAPAGIDVAIDESDAADFADGTAVTLTANPANGTGFVGWGEACTDAGDDLTCSLTLTADTMVTAEFVELVGVAITVDFLIVEGADDAEEFKSDVNAFFPAGGVQVTSSDIDLTYDAAFGAGVVVGLRYQGVSIPAGAVIDAATITFTRHAGGNGAPVLTVQGEASDSAAPIVGDGDGTASFGISGREHTVASTEWANPTPWDETSVSPDLADIVQEIVDRDGWASGNALAFIITSENSDSANFRRAQSFEGGNPAVLSVTYTVLALPDPEAELSSR